MKLILAVALTLLFLIPTAVSAQSQAETDAAAALKAGNFKEAAKLYKKITKADPNNAEAWYQLGIVYFFDKNKKEKAVEAFKRSTQIKPDEPMYWGRYGQALIAVDQFTLAEEAIKKVIELQPNVASNYYLHAFVLYLQQEYTLAGEKLDKANELDPNFAPAYLLRASLVLRLASQPVDRRLRAAQFDERIQQAEAAMRRFNELKSNLKVDPAFTEQLAALKWFADFYRRAERSNTSDGSEPSAGAGNGLKVLKKEPPSYSREAKDQGVSGTVRLLVAFRSNGTIGPILVLKGLGHGLTEKAIEAARRIKFKPTIVNGVPVDAVRQVEFTFEVL